MMDKIISLGGRASAAVKTVRLDREICVQNALQIGAHANLNLISSANMLLTLGEIDAASSMLAAAEIVNNLILNRKKESKL